MNPFKVKQLSDFTIADCEEYIQSYPSTPVTRTEPLNPYTYSGGGTTYYPCERCGGSGEISCS